MHISHRVFTINTPHDEPQKSATETEALFSKHPQLKGIIAPTTVGLASAAQVVTQKEVFPGGKNAKNNDLLTLKYAKKQDIWLHARDVSGSHVIIRNPQNRTVPAFVIEKAASLAAYFSKRQTESLCPVIVTSKKFVRKTKDLLPGMVIVDREEEVVLVKPELWD